MVNDKLASHQLLFLQRSCQRQKEYICSTQNIGTQYACIGDERIRRRKGHACAHGGWSFGMFADELPKVPQEKGLVNTTPFGIFAKELFEGPEGEHWHVIDSLSLYTGCIRVS